MEAREDTASADARPEAERVFAAIDLGTNNCRLMLAKARGESFAIVDSFSRIVRLGEGLSRSGVLLEGAIDRTMQALEICAGKIARWGVIDQRHIATEACRRAANCDEFVARVAERTGLSASALAGCDVRARIPMHAGVDSLNVAAAAAVACYALGPPGSARR